jgi:hypothetical protein
MLSAVQIKDQKMKKINKTILLTVAVMCSFVSIGQALAQADSTTGNRAGNWNAVIPRGHLDLPAQPTPIVNNISNITQIVQPNTFQVSGTGAGQTTATAQADCGGGTLLGGGGTCSDGQGLVAVAGSSPVGNSWVIGCQSLNYKPVFATANAICSSN